MLRVAIVCAMLAYVSAQDYSCVPGFCLGQGYDRIDEMGCEYFCYMDTLAPAGGLTCEEFHATYAAWKGSAAECDYDCFYAANKEVLPRACDVELQGTYDILAAFDEDASTISGSDIQSWCDYVLVLEPTGDVISPQTFRTFWNILYAEVGVESC